MTTNAAGFDFSQFIPGFDFLKQMGQPQGMPPALSQWIAPTLDPQEIARRIQDLKTVLFWLEQNTTALKATIQALEVQQLTCQTLHNMNAGVAGWAQQMQDAMAAATAGDGGEAAAAPAGSASETSSQAHSATDKAAAAEAQPADAEPALNAAVEQASQWWNTMFQTFSHIANQAQNEVAQRQEEFAHMQKDFVPTGKAQAKASATPKARPRAATSKPRTAAKPRATAAKKSATAKPAAKRTGTSRQEPS